MRSHSEDERGSVREIGLWIWMEANVHSSMLSLMAWKLIHFGTNMNSFGDDPTRDEMFITKLRVELQA